MWKACELGRDDWFLIADADEFHEYPCPLEAFLTHCNDQRCNAVEGRLIDRVTNEGGLGRLAVSPSIFEQFPRTVDISNELLGMNPQKIIADQRTTFSGRLRRANHGIDPAFVDMTRVLPETCLVHHFKWHLGTIEKIRRRVEHYQRIGRTTDAERHLRLLEWCDKHRSLPSDVSIAS